MSLTYSYGAAVCGVYGLRFELPQKLVPRFGMKRRVGMLVI